MSVYEDARRYERAMHAMQTGVAYDQGYGSEDGTPKHLRVGVNAALACGAATARLLIEKGVITEDEYTAACADQMEREVATYEQRLSTRLGTTVTLS